MSLHFKGATARFIREHNASAWHAWHTAYLTAYAPAKSREFVRLKKLTHTDEPTQVRQTPEQQLAIARAWMASRRR